MEETRTQPRSTPSSICGAHGHGGDRPPRQLETVCARDDDRLLRCEVLMLQATDLAPPQTSVDARLQHWALLLCPSERDVTSKTLAFRGSRQSTSNRRTSLFGLLTSLPTTTYSTPSRHEPTLPSSEWNLIHCATTPSRDTETLLR